MPQELKNTPNHDLVRALEQPLLKAQTEFQEKFGLKAMVLSVPAFTGAMIILSYDRARNAISMRADESNTFIYEGETFSTFSLVNAFNEYHNEAFR